MIFHLGDMTRCRPRYWVKCRQSHVVLRKYGMENGCTTSTPNSSVGKDLSHNTQITFFWYYFPFVGWKVTPYCYYIETKLLLNEYFFANISIGALVFFSMDFKICKYALYIKGINLYLICGYFSSLSLKYYGI